MIRRIREKDVAEKILVISNAVLLTPQLWTELRDAGLSEIKISIQGMTAEKYKSICEASINVDDFLKMLTYVYKHRGNCTIRIKIADAALDAGEDKLFYEKFGSICNYIAIEHIYEQFKFVDYEGKLDSGYKNNRFGYDFKPIKVCSALFFKMNVLQDGRITFGYPDGVTFEGFKVGEKSLYDVWNSPERYGFLTDNLTGNYSNRNDCKNCTRWAYSVVPEDLLDGYEEDILARMPQIDLNVTDLPKPVILCGNVGC
jgi:MoaA/NifB/PqqE/SkfB family radical SAM enzyme